MTFQDYTVMRGVIQSHRTYESDDLSSVAILWCRALLPRAREGRIRVIPPDMPDALNFHVMVGLPGDLGEDPALRLGPDDGAWFVVYDGEAPQPFQLNLVAKTASPQVQRAIGGVFGLSETIFGGAVPDPLFAESCQAILSTPPFLATTLLPYARDPRVIKMAADFSTCFAAVLLQED